MRHVIPCDAISDAGGRKAHDGRAMHNAAAVESAAGETNRTRA